MFTGFVVFPTFPGVNEVESLLIMLISSVIKKRLSNNVHRYATALLMEELSKFIIMKDYISVRGIACIDVFYKHHGYKHHQAEIWLRFFANS